MNEKEKTSAKDLFRVEATSANYFVHQPDVKVKTRSAIIAIDSIGLIMMN